MEWFDQQVVILEQLQSELWHNFWSVQSPIRPFEWCFQVRSNIEHRESLCILHQRSI